MTTTSRVLVLGAGIGLLLALPFAARAGPALVVTPYLSAANSPFSPGSFTYFHLENFEDHLLNTPGVSASLGSGVTSSFEFSGTIIDSVQGDGACPPASAPIPCDSYFPGSGAAGIIFTFKPSETAHRSDKRHLRRAAETRPPLGTPAQHPGRSAS